MIFLLLASLRNNEISLRVKIAEKTLHALVLQKYLQAIVLNYLYLSSRSISMVTSREMS